MAESKYSLFQAICDPLLLVYGRQCSFILVRITQWSSTKAWCASRFSTPDVVCHTRVLTRSRVVFEFKVSVQSIFLWILLFLAIALFVSYFACLPFFFVLRKYDSYLIFTHRYWLCLVSIFFDMYPRLAGPIRFMFRVKFHYIKNYLKKMNFVYFVDVSSCLPSAWVMTVNVIAIRLFRDVVTFIVIS